MRRPGSEPIREGGSFQQEMGDYVARISRFKQGGCVLRCAHRRSRSGSSCSGSSPALLQPSHVLAKHGRGELLQQPSPSRGAMAFPMSATSHAEAMRRPAEASGWPGHLVSVAVKVVAAPGRSNLARASKPSRTLTRSWLNRSSCRSPSLIFGESPVGLAAQAPPHTSPAHPARQHHFPSVPRTPR